MILELHLLQNVSPSCLNRDDANAPKDCEFGGSRRARISSQCLKRSIREEFKSILPNRTGTRSKLIAQELARILAEKVEKPLEELTVIAYDIISACYAKAGKKEGEASVLLFFDTNELTILAEKAALILNSGQSSKGAAKQKKNKNDEASPWDDLADDASIKPNSVDIALFGRMLAEKPGKNIDGSCQVAHAISTNKVQMEFDFFTAVDDLRPADQPGAGMMGTVGYNSSCFYRYAVINIDALSKNLSGDTAAIHDAVRAFITASFTAMPTGKQNSFAAHNPPSLGFALIRESNMPWSLANAFEKPVRPSEKKGLVASSIEAMSSYWDSLSTVYAAQLNLKGAASVMLPTIDTENINATGVLQFSKSTVEELINSIDALIE
ncbi:MAG: type I-E CRISPR-associated protein Cas7/Cse4/CasC [Ignavibacteria bacterium]|nr:type I-E CRISPR-associated protein Cas7/Cse4/CasC [Ignavibacteria bacterium]